MDDFLSISLLSLAMLVGCYVAGIIPLAVNFSEVRRFSVFCELSGRGGSRSVVAIVRAVLPFGSSPKLKVFQEGRTER